MILNLVNTTGSPKSYLSGAVTVAANSSSSVSSANQYNACVDGQIRSDCITGILNVTDGVTTFGTTDAVNYLNFIATQLLLTTVITSTASINRYEWDQQAINGNAYCMMTADSQLSVGTSEKSCVYLKNNGSKTMYIYNMFLVADPSVSANWLEYRVYYDPTVTANGTALTAANHLPGSSNTSGANGYANPTTTANGNMIDIWIDGAANSAGPLKEPSTRTYFILPPGHSLLITALAKGNSTSFYANICWFEV